MNITITTYESGRASLPKAKSRGAKVSRQTPLVVRDGKRTLTTSRIVAAKWERAHRTITAAIEKQLAMIEDSAFSAQNFLQRDFVDERGKAQREWVMTKSGFAAVAMGFTGTKSANLRVEFVKAFEKATKRIQTLERRDPEWKTARKQVAENQSLMGMVLTATRERAGKATEGWHHANEAWLLTYALTGKAKPAIDRQTMSAQELEVLADVEKLNTRLLVLGKPYETRKSECRTLALAQMTKQVLLTAGGAA
jgi:Rha family phage regulatory protein